MQWLAINWFWVLIGGLFIGMHLFGHGGHGGHASSAHPERSDMGETTESTDLQATEDRGSRLY
jgi:hypothetical protein